VEGTSEKLRTMCLQVLNLYTIVYTLMVSVFMPNWYIPLTLSSSAYGISRSLIVFYLDKQTAINMTGPIAFGFGIVVV
jgi:hypothetical protein